MNVLALLKNINEEHVHTADLEVNLTFMYVTTYYNSV
jgi:hypothetical protein